jgi:uncharacterized DUF497 family protein
MDFEWDHKKSRANLEKHGIAFEDALLVFDEFHMTVSDTRKNYGEKRFCTMGILGDKKRVVIIAHAYRKNKIRIISMRKANKREQKVFYNYLNKYLKVDLL